MVLILPPTQGWPGWVDLWLTRYRDKPSLIAVLARLDVHCVSNKRHPFNFCDNFVSCRSILLVFDMIIGKSIYNVPALTYLLETKIFSIVEYQLKCCSVADDAAPDCRMVWSAAVCCRQRHQWVAWMAAHLCESWWTTLRTLALSRKLLFLDWFYCLTLLTFISWLARSQIVACFTRYSCNM